MRRWRDRPARISRLAVCGALLVLATLARAGEAAPLPDWRDVIRQTPYWESQGVHANLATIRRWVLNSEGFCSAAEHRHILFDRRMRFLGYLSDPGGVDANQAKLNRERQRLAAEGKVQAWTEGAEGRPGYPFALSCHQPHARLADGLDRYTGADTDARLWGTWDGMRIGTRAQPVSLHQALRDVYDDRLAANRISLEPALLSTLAGKIIIESGGQADARSPAGALGIMQLTPAVLQDCSLDRRFYFHRLAQIDCALYVLEQNHRVLQEPFAAMFGHLPERKASALYQLLLIQAYHGGIGRVRDLLTDETLSAPARYFAEYPQKFSAGDIALGMVFHNLGRRGFGFASLYYVTDVSIAAEEVCRQVEVLGGCAASAEHGQHDSQFTVAPLQVEQGTGSPCNPIALL